MTIHRRGALPTYDLVVLSLRATPPSGDQGGLHSLSNVARRVKSIFPVDIPSRGRSRCVNDGSST